MDGQARVKVSVDANVALGKNSGGIGLHRIRRDLGDVQPQLGRTLEAGWEVISNCEELSHAYAQRPRLSPPMDELTVNQAVTLVGTGINANFMMDTLPLLLSTVCLFVESIGVTRVLDAEQSPKWLQETARVNLAVEPFQARVS